MPNTVLYVAVPRTCTGLAWFLPVLEYFFEVALYLRFQGKSELFYLEIRIIIKLFCKQIYCANLNIKYILSFKQLNSLCELFNMYVRFLLCLDISSVDVCVAILVWHQKDFFDNGSSELHDKALS